MNYLFQQSICVALQGRPRISNVMMAETVLITIKKKCMMLLLYNISRISLENAPQNKDKVNK